MRWNRDNTDEQRLRTLKALGWHSWFAWHPVRVSDGTGDWVWLEWVDRRAAADSRVFNRAEYSYGGLYLTWEYRAHRQEGIWTRVNCDPRDEDITHHGGA